MIRKGFTLLELLVVIAIVAILLGILIPSLRMAKEQTRTVLCRTNLRQFGILYSMYADDNKQSLPAGWNSGKMWMMDLIEYYEGADDIRLCPSATIFLHTVPDNIARTFTAWGKYGNPNYFDGWVPPWGQKDQYGSYGVNGWAHNPPDTGVPGTYNIPQDNRPLYWRTIQAKGAGQVPLMGDCMWDGSEPREGDAPPPSPGEQVTRQRDERFLHRPPPGLGQYAVSGFLVAEGGPEGIVEAPLAHQVELHSCQSRLAGMDAAVSGFLRAGSEGECR